ncbi:MAG: acyl-CoA dehydrogenase family protein [Chitinophagales bacterium]|nr:acyl-CoA dehydrogenase family protein [Chitinophagales bacterium]MDW8418711.1 acyl-CoA dehydrogenase family protein [Chitinophagales bacterium]
MYSRYFTEEHELFRQTVRDFVQKEVVPHINEWEENECIPRQIFKRMGDLGFLGINFPESVGGTDNDFWYSVVYLEELARAGFAGLAAAVSVHQYMATNHILLAGSEYLKQKYLVPSVKGEYVGSIAISEPGAGSDVANLRCTARREGDYYILNGNKTFITNGYYGNFVTVACKTDPDAGVAGISLIVVDQGLPGFTKTKLKKMGWRSSDTAELFFDNVKVPVQNLVGREGQGFFYIMESFQLERLIAGILAVAGAEEKIRVTQQYMRERHAFNKPLNKFQVLRHRMVDLISELEITKQYVYHCCDLFARGVFAVKECSIAKMKATELGKTIADECLQMFGGYGYMQEYPIERAYRDARVGTIVGGTTEIMKEIIAKMVIDGVNYESAYKNMKEADRQTASDTPHTAPAAAQSNGKPQTAREIIYSLPARLKTDKVKPEDRSVFHFKLSGNTGGEFTVTLLNGSVTVQDGLHGEASCVISAAATDYEDLELGRANPQMMFMMGKIKVSNLNEVMKFTSLFKRLST